MIRIFTLLLFLVSKSLTLFAEEGRDLKTFGNDFWGGTKKTYWGTGGILMVSGIALNYGLELHHDVAQEKLGAAYKHSADDSIFKFYTLWYPAITTVTAGSLWYFGNSYWSQVGYAVSQSLLATEILTQTLKFTVRRERPDGSDHYSFPSGHTANAFAFSTSITLMQDTWIKRALIGIPTLALATQVAISRVYDNKHWTSDILFGMIVGIANGYGFDQYHLKNEEPLFQIQPLALKDTRGINLAWAF